MAIAVHHTDTTDEDWDAGMMVKRCPADEGHLHAMHAWMDPEGDPESKGSYKFPHHMVGMDGDVMAASVKGCSAGIAVLNGGRGGADIPDSDRRGVYRHLAAHMTDADVEEVPDLRSLFRQAREERVFTLDQVEVRDGEPGKPARIVGHAAVFNSWSEDLGGYRERIAPGAFRKTVQESDIRALWNHDPNFVLGRTKSSTLSLHEDKKGLLIEITPPDTQLVRDLVLEPMRRGDVDQASFAFRAIAEEMSAGPNRAGLYERTLQEMQLFDVSPVTFPVYSQTDMAVRSILASAGIDWAALTVAFTRAERGLTPSGSDIDLFTGSIAVLRSYLPVEPVPARHSTAEQAGRSVAHLRRLLELHEHSLLSG